MDLKKARTELRATQEDVAKRLGVSQQTIARWEAGKGEIPAKYLKDLAVLFGSTVSDLLDKERRTLRSEDDSNLPYGTLHIRFQASGHRPRRRQRSDDDEVYVQVSEEDRYFPIAEGERDRLLTLLEVRGISSEQLGWLCFTSLDNRLVFVNASQIERIALISDDAEAMPFFEHAEVYKLAREIAFGHAPSEEELNSESSPYSRSLVDKARCVVNELGGHAILWLDGVAVDTVQGEREFFTLDNQTLSDLNSLELQGQYAGDDAVVNLYSEGYYRGTFFRLGSLRSIEIPWDRYSDWLRSDSPDN